MGTCLALLAATVRRVGLVSAALGATLVALPASVHADPVPTVTSFSYRSSAGDWVGQGRTATHAASASVSFTPVRGGYMIDLRDNGERWTVQFAAPVGEALRPGVYGLAERFPHQTGRAPGLAVSSTSRGCSHSWGQFFVHQWKVGGGGAVEAVDVEFAQRCDSPTAPVLSGRLKVNAAALSYQYVSAAGDHIGKGKSATHENARSFLRPSFGYDARDLRFEVNGLRQRWSFRFVAPGGARITAGSWPTTRTGTGGTAVLDVSSEGAGCNMSKGTMTVRDVRWNSDGTLGGLWVVFTQYCDGSSAPLTGTLRYYR